MSWTRVERAFLVKKDEKLKCIDIGVCDVCSGIHIPAEEASACECEQTLTYEEIKKKFNNNQK